MLVRPRTATTLDPALSELADALALQLLEVPATGRVRRLLERRLLAVQGWESASAKDGPGSSSRERQMDAARRAQALSAERDALLARARLQLTDSAQLLDRLAGVRAVLAHRNDWFRSKVAAALTDAGVQVVGEVADGATAVGLIVAEQPDVALVEELLPTYRGREVLQRLRQHAPHTRVGVQLADNTPAGPLAGHGAVAVFSRRLPPAELASRLAECATSPG